MTGNRVFALALATLLAACESSGTAGNSTATTTITKNAKDVSVTLNSVDVSKDIGSMGIVPSAPEGAIYVVAVYTLKNTGAASLSMTQWPQPRLLDAKGHQFEPEIFSSTAMSAAANVNWAENLNPNLSTEITQVWKIDEKAFDRKTWTIEFQSKPKLTFPLQ